MTGKNSPDYACGQVLFCIKMSKLNYLVQETPYSVHITLRKKFLNVKNANSVNNDIAAEVAETNDDEPRNSFKEKLVDVEKENKELREKIKDNLHTIEMFRVENEELETKNDDLESEKNQQDDTVEELYREISHLKKSSDNFENENSAVKDKLKKCQAEIQDLKKKNENIKSDSIFLKSKLETSEEKVIELRCILEGYNQENYCNKCEYKIETLTSVESAESKNGDEDAPSTSKCGQCGYKSDSDDEIKKHIEDNHEIFCNVCDLTFSNKVSLANHTEEKHTSDANKSESVKCITCGSNFSTEEKLKNHLCRVTVKNPTFCNFYTKNWIAVNRCTSVFHRIKKEEIAILHCQDCVSNEKRCGEKYPLWFPAQEDREDGTWHFEMIKFLKDGRIDWQSANKFIKTD